MMQRPTSGLVIDGFVLGECLHRGGFATIWQVAHPDHTLPMVMKVPTILDGDDAPTIVGFEVEQMIMPRLSGQHVPRVIAVGDFAVMPYIVTERIEGGSLFGLFDTAPRPLSEVIETAARMAAAVHDLHRQDVIHLDLKPANFLQRPSGEMVAIDFGLSRHQRLPDLLAEEFRIPMGTYPYIAPEQILGLRDDLRSDIFAMGAMLYELATGRRPFGEPAHLRGTRKRLWRDPLPPRALDRSIPEWLQEIVLRALDVDPAARYQSAAQLMFDLTHPAQVRLTERAYRTHADPWHVVLRRWWRMRRVKRLSPPPPVGEQIARAPILMVAVDLAPDMEHLAAAILTAVRRMLSVEPDARIACVNVIRTARIGIDQATTADGDHIHVSRLVALRAWAESLERPEDRLTYTILEGPDPARVLIEHADRLKADHILMGARSHSSTRRFLGSVSSQIVAEASCSVTVVRVPARDASGPAEEEAQASVEIDLVRDSAEPLSSMPAGITRRRCPGR